MFVTEGGADNRQAAWDQQGSPDALNGSRQDQGQHRGREATPDGGQGEDRDAHGKDAPSSKVIAQGSSHQNERGQEKRIGFHNPLDIAGGGVEISLDDWQGDIDDGAINKSHA